MQGYRTPCPRMAFPKPEFQVKPSGIRKGEPGTQTGLKQATELQYRPRPARTNSNPLNGGQGAQTAPSGTQRTLLCTSDDLLSPILGPIGRARHINQKKRPCLRLDSPKRDSEGTFAPCSPPLVVVSTQQNVPNTHLFQT